MYITCLCIVSWNRFTNFFVKCRCNRWIFPITRFAIINCLCWHENRPAIFAQLHQTIYDCSSTTNYISETRHLCMYFQNLIASNTKTFQCLDKTLFCHWIRNCLFHLCHTLTYSIPLQFLYQQPRY